MELESIINSGSTATVYRSSRAGEAVAVKVLKDESLKLRLAVCREMAILEGVSHPNVVSFYSSYEVAGKINMVLELCQGGDLCSLLYHHHIDLPNGHKIKMLLDVAQAMVALHGSSPAIMHRDLKSPNLLLTQKYSSDRTPVVKVCDFGFARAKDKNSKSWGRMTKNVGSSFWMAPEVPTGTYDEKADVYSYAMVMFEVISQELPFEGTQSCEVASLVLQGDRPDLDAIPPDFPEEMQALMRESWSRDPLRRPSFPAIRDTVAEAMSAFYTQI